MSDNYEYDFSQVVSGDFVVFMHIDSWSHGHVHATIFEVTDPRPNYTAFDGKMLPSGQQSQVLKASIFAHASTQDEAQSIASGFEQTFRAAINKLVNDMTADELVDFRKGEFERLFIKQEADARMTSFGFDTVIRLLKQGKYLAREGWNGKNMLIYMVESSTFHPYREPLKSLVPDGIEVTYCAHIDMKAADGSICVWNPSQVDMFADDWVLVERK